MDYTFIIGYNLRIVYSLNVEERDIDQENTYIFSRVEPSILLCRRTMSEQSFDKKTY